MSTVSPAGGASQVEQGVLRRNIAPQFHPQWWSRELQRGHEVRDGVLLPAGAARYVESMYMSPMCASRWVDGYRYCGEATSGFSSIFRRSLELAARPRSKENGAVPRLSTGKHPALLWCFLRPDKYSDGAPLCCGVLSTFFPCSDIYTGDSRAWRGVGKLG